VRKEIVFVRIGVADTLSPAHKLERYLEWLRRRDPAVEFVVLSYQLGNASEIGKVDGLLMTGGGDIHPAYYGMDVELDRVEGVDERRDVFEFDLVDRALDADLPVLGICRGMQLVNVYLGGSLIVDLPSAGHAGHASAGDDEKYHEVAVAPPSLLGEMTGAENLMVNSSHHQAIGRLGNGLVVSAVSPDGVTESAEWILRDRMPFLLLVQWHPERMKDVGCPAVRSIADGFLKEVKHSMERRRASYSIHSNVN
jgi:putative glutamine amidotransferase